MFAVLIYIYIHLNLYLSRKAWQPRLSHFRPCTREPRTNICELGRRGASTGRPQRLLPEHQEAATWLESHNLASRNPNGRLIFHSSALVFGTVLSNPARVYDPPNPLDRSLWSLRRQLLFQGWEVAVSGRQGSVANKKFNCKSEHQAYYAILLERCAGDI